MLHLSFVLKLGDIAQIGRCANVSNSQKNVIARGCTPFTVGKLADQLRPLVHGQCLAGAGGGGFMFAILKEKVDRSVIQSIISSIEVSISSQNFISVLSC